MKLIYRLYSPNEGKISPDGFDISKVELKSLRNQIGIVPKSLYYLMEQLEIILL